LRSKGGIGGADKDRRTEEPLNDGPKNL
jgi:hypothetical protein